MINLVGGVHQVVKERHILHESAIRVEAGPGKEDRLRTGSYVALRQREKLREERRRRNRAGNDDYLPEFLR